MTNLDVLMRAVKHGDEIAFSALVDEMLPALTRSLQRRGVSLPDAEEIASETMLRLHTHADDFTGSGVVAWATRIARNLVATMRRDNGRLKRGGNITFADSESAIEDDTDQPLSREPEPSFTAETREAAGLVLDALDGIDDATGYTVLAYAEGWTLTEIAEDIGAPLGTVKGRLRIGRQKVRDMVVATS